MGGEPKFATAAVSPLSCTVCMYTWMVPNVPKSRATQSDADWPWFTSTLSALLSNCTTPKG